MTVTTVTQPKTITKTVGGKTVTMTPEHAEEFGRELDALKERDADKAGALMATNVSDGSSQAVKLLEEIGFWKSDEDTGRSRRSS